MPCRSGACQETVVRSPRLSRVCSIAVLLAAHRRFGNQVEFVHCINMILFTPITEELLLYDFMEREWPVLATAFDGRDQGGEARISGVPLRSIKSSLAHEAPYTDVVVADAELPVSEELLGNALELT